MLVFYHWEILLSRQLSMLNRRPRAGGDPVTLRRTPLDSRLRGNDENLRLIEVPHSLTSQIAPALQAA